MVLSTAKMASLVIGTAIFLGVMVYVGYRTEQWIDSASDFMVSGREINYLVIGGAFAAIGLAGSMVSAVPQFAIGWGVFPAAMYLLAWCAIIVLFGFFVAPIIRRTGVYTTSEWMEQRFDRKTRMIAAVASTIGIVGVSAAQFVGLGVIIAELTDFSYFVTSLAILIVLLAYMYLGGLWAVTVNDVVQVIFGGIAIILVTAWLWVTFGSPGWVADQVPAHLQLWGTGVIEPVALTFNSPFTWFFGWGALVIASQYYWIRLVSARSEEAAKKGTIFGAVVTAVFFTVLLALPGAYALAVFGPPGEAGYAAGGVFGLLIAEMPIVLDAFILVALIAALMSTISTTIIGIVSILIRDVWEPLIGTATTSDELMKPSRYFTVLIGVLAWLWAVTWQQGAGLMLALGWSFLAPLVAVFLLGLVWKRTTGEGAFLGVIAGIVGVSLWQYAPMSFWSVFGLAQPPGAIAHETWVGLFVPAIVTIVVSLVTSPQYYGSGDWIKPTESGDRPTADGGHRRTDLQPIALELAKPWTPSSRWNEFVERRGSENGLIVTLLRARPDDGNENEAEAGDRDE